MQRYACFLSAYRYKIKYINTDKNKADALSRSPLAGTEQNDPHNGVSYLNFLSENDSLTIDINKIKLESKNDPILRKVFNYVVKCWPENKSQYDAKLLPYFLRRNELSLEKGILMLGHKVVIPQKLHEYVLSELHSVHFGIVKMKATARSYVWWLKLIKL